LEKGEILAQNTCTVLRESDICKVLVTSVQSVNIHYKN